MEKIEIKGAPGGLIIFRVSIESKVIAPIVIQASLENWVSGDGKIYPVDFKNEPVYSFLQTGGTAKVTFMIRAPKDVKSGERLFGSITIPSTETFHYPIQLDLIAPKKDGDDVSDFSVKIEVPPKSKSADQADQNYLISKSTIKLLSGFASLEVIPSKWIVSELILNCCKKGYEYAKTEEGTNRLKKLSKTRFYKNGVLIFRGTQLVEWITLSLSISSGINTMVGGKKSEGMFLQNWEEWLFNLIDQDIESPDFEHRKIEMPTPIDYEKILETLGLDPEKWFSFFILGLGRISTRIDSIIEQVISEIEEPPSQNEKTDSDSHDDVLSEKESIKR